MDLFIKYWGGRLKWINKHDGGPHEANFLKLDCSRLKNTFGWKPNWSINKAVEETVKWSKSWIKKRDIRECMDIQIKEFLEDI